MSTSPELTVAQWFNTPAPLTLGGLRGRVVVLHAFQMLCPGCVAQAMPQAQRLHQMFGDSGVAVIGLHSVFEHHAAMTPVALQAFIHEYRLSFPIAVDQPGVDDPLPVTMRRFQMRGTPTTLVFDRDGRLRLHGFGQIDDLALGVTIGTLLAETDAAVDQPSTAAPDGCGTDRCAAPNAP